MVDFLDGWRSGEGLADSSFTRLFASIEDDAIKVYTSNSLLNNKQFKVTIAKI